MYINYPMIESLKYTKEIPDANYWRYVATREECASHKFKGNAERFAYSEAKAFRFIDLVKTERQKVADNWEKLKFQNVCKANIWCLIVIRYLYGNQPSIKKTYLKRKKANMWILTKVSPY